jgi:TetR/AcrR family transcriptional repressor of nem operon
MTNSDTKTALLECAQNLIQSVGVNAMSYNDLSQAVGIRKASIHYHFPKKEDLIKALIERCSEVFGEKYRSIVESENTAKRKLHMLASIYEDGVKNGRLCPIGMLSAEFRSLSKSTQKTLNLKIKHTAEIFEKIFIQGAKEHVFSPEQNTFDLAYGFFSFLLGAQIISRCANSPDGFRKAVEAYIDSLAAE